MKGNRALVAAVALLFVGLVGLVTAPSLERVRSVDVLRLLASGACFGAAIWAMIGHFRRPRAPGL